MFAANSYFTELALKKSFVMCKQNVIEKCIGTPISWQPGCDTTHAKKKKGKGKNKQTVLVKCPSFFNFFETVQTEKEVTPGGEEAQKGQEDSEDTQAEQMEADFDMGCKIRDEVVPLALEYFLNALD